MKRDDSPNPCRTGGLRRRVAPRKVFASLLVLAFSLAPTASAFQTPGQNETPLEAQTPDETPSPASAAPEAAQAALPGQQQPAASPATQVSAEQPLPIQLQPYRIHIGVAFAGDPRLTPRFRSQALEQLASSVHRVMGRMWEPTIELSTWLAPGDMAALERLTEEQMRERTPESRFDKAIVLCIDMRGNRFVIAARQWDAKSRELGPLRIRETCDRRTVASEAFSVVHVVFQPVAEVTDVSDDGQVTMLLRAGELYPSDPEAAQVVPGSLMQPYFRYMDRDFQLRQINRVPWTYLTVDDIDVAILHCSPVSGIRAPITKSRRRVEVVASLVQPDLDRTVIKLVPFRNPGKPLVGHYVQVSAEPKPAEAQDDQLELLSGRAGEVVIPRDPEHPLVWIRVRSGNSILARVPFVPGVEPHRVMELPDDTERLRVEGQVATLQGELVDNVARRAILLSLVRSLAESGDWKNFDKQMASLQKLPETRYFESRLTAIRVPAVESARKRRDRSAEGRVNRLCDQMAELIKRFLDPRQLQLVKEEIRELLSRRAQVGNNSST